MDEEFLTTEEVAERYRTVPSTVRYWRHVGSGPRSIKTGRRVLYRLSDVLVWEESRLTAAGGS